MTKLLWMVIYINGQIAGVFLNEPMPDYMTFEECEASAAQQTRRGGAVFKCEYHYGKPVNTGHYYRPME